MFQELDVFHLSISTVGYSNHTAEDNLLNQKSLNEEGLYAKSTVLSHTDVVFNAQILSLSEYTIAEVTEWEDINESTCSDHSGIYFDPDLSELATNQTRSMSA